MVGEDVVNATAAAAAAAAEVAGGLRDGGVGDGSGLVCGRIMSVSD